MLRKRQGGRRARVLIPAAAGAVVVMASSAWACVPGAHVTDRQTRIASCTPPPDATRPCKTPVGAPPFPEATFVKGPSGSSFVAYVYGPGMDWNVYDLVFASQPQLQSGQACASAASAVLVKDVVATSGGIPPTTGQIPPNAPLGLSQVCFTDVLRTQAEGAASTPAQFKVTI